jgi:FkbM family methyltransferase
MLTQRIHTALQHSQGPVCDVCLSQVAIIGDEALTRSLSTRLARQGMLRRARRPCSLCGQEKDGTELLAKSNGGSPNSAAAPEPASPFAATGPLEHLDELTALIGENAVIQSRVSEAIALRLLKLEKSLGEIQTTIQSLAANTPPGGRFAVYQDDHLALTRVLNLFKMYVDTTDISLAPHLMMDAQWEPEITRLITQSLKPGMTVVDVGANWGYYTLLAGVLVGNAGKVYAVEPDPRNFAILKKNVAVNGFDTFVQTFMNAAFDARKTVELHRRPAYLGCHHLFAGDPATPAASTVAVDAVPLDDIVPGAVDFMKIDAEGSEPFIFEGMRGLLARSPGVQVIMEFNLIALGLAGVEPLRHLCQISELGFTSSIVNEQGGLETVDKERLMSKPISTLFLTRGRP